MFHSTGRQTVYTSIYIHIVLLIFVEPFDNAVSDGGGVIIHVIIVKLYVFSLLIKPISMIRLVIFVCLITM